MTALQYIHCLGFQVQYNTDGWLDKNKDPINDSVVQLLQQAKEVMVNAFFSPAAGTWNNTNKFHNWADYRKLVLYL